MKKHPIVEIYSPIKIAIVDDHSCFTKALEIILKLYPDLKPIITADNGAHLLQLIENNRPDVILLDIRMPVMDGLTTLKELQTVYPEIKVIMLSMDLKLEDVKEALRLGASACLLKTSEPGLIAKTIREVFYIGG